MKTGGMSQPCAAYYKTTLQILFDAFGALRGFLTLHFVTHRAGFDSLNIFENIETDKQQNFLQN